MNTPMLPISTLTIHTVVPLTQPMSFLTCNVFFYNKTTKQFLTSAPACIALHNDLFPTISISALLHSTLSRLTLLTSNPHGSSTATNVTKLTFHALSLAAAQANLFDNFPTSLTSVRKTADDGMISIFTKAGITVHNENDVLITCRGEPILIGVHNSQGCYDIPLVQQHGQWQPQLPCKHVTKALRQAISIFNLPSIKQAI
ncbi:hypothetical protein ACHAW6_010408 [Cyclotella cf. meneghiniana]